MSAIAAAWRKQIAPNMIKSGSTEAGFPVYRSPGGGYQPGNGPTTGPVDKQIQMGSARGFAISYRSEAVAIFHTHPRGDPGYPSTPSNNAGENSNGDTGMAVEAGKDIYVISDRGLSEAPATGPRNPKYDKHNSPWIVQANGIDGLLKKLKQKCGTM
jgi:hypothetical protein